MAANPTLTSAIVGWLHCDHSSAVACCVEGLPPEQNPSTALQSTTTAGPVHHFHLSILNFILQFLDFLICFYRSELLSGPIKLLMHNFASTCLLCAVIAKYHFKSSKKRRYMQFYFILFYIYPHKYL